MSKYSSKIVLVSKRLSNIYPRKLDKSINPNNPRNAFSINSVSFSTNSIKPSPDSEKANTSSSLKKALDSSIDMLMNPRQTWILIKEAIVHYWVGTKLLWSEIKITNQILGRLLQGHGMTRRERMQLVRTSTDLFRLVPFSIFIIVPFMEFLLPFALRLFPNMLPSTFQDNLKKEETMKKELQMRLAIASFMQDTLKEMATTKDKKMKSGEKDSESGAAEVIEFIEKARMGQPIPNDVVIRMARLFQDELTLANISRPQLVSMCQYMNLPPYGADMFLRFQLRTKLRAIKEDDRRILWEGMESLNTVELREACRERGMRSMDLTQFRLRKQLQEWLDLSIQKNIPISLMIMSRALNLSTLSTEDTAATVLKSSISSLDADIINEVVIAAASPNESNTTDMRQRKLESIEFQREMIAEEREDAEEAKVSMKEQLMPSMSNTSSNSSNSLLPSSSSSSSSSSQNPLITTISSNRDMSVTTTSSILPTDKSSSIDTNSHNTSSILTVSEIQAISDLARGSSVQREKAELAILQANIDTHLKSPSEEEVKTTTTTTNNMKVNSSEKTQDKSVNILKTALNSMLDRLKIRIDVTEKELGDKFNLLDKDGDGELTSEELKDAMVKILKRTTTAKDAEELIQILDRDNDGKVSLVELLHYVQSKKDVSEVEVLEAHLHSTTAAAIQKEKVGT